jgi:hypothetical protein
VSVRAPVVVAACGAVQTPALLARSGVRSASGMLGRNLTIHPGAALLGFFDEEVRGWEGVHQAFQLTEFVREGILVSASTLPPALIALNLPERGAALSGLMEDYNKMVAAGCLVEDSSSGHVQILPGGHPVARYEMTALDAERVVLGLAKAAEVMVAAGACRLAIPVMGAPLPLDADEALRLLDGPVPARALRPFTVHAMGTARISRETNHGVVSSFGEVHGAPGLFVSDASMLPGPVGVNPMETIIALALRNADRLIDNRSQYKL